MVNKKKVGLDFHIEKQLGGVVIGIDEAGRGPLAGPVVAAATIIPMLDIFILLNDSKKLSKNIRERCFQLIQEHGRSAVGIAEVYEIEQLNILQATLLAMRRAVDALDVQYDAIIVDGNISPYPTKPDVIPIIGGDAKSLSIAAASIVAKVTRDKIMQKLHLEHPLYGWEQNAGYGTAAHINAIKRFGVSIHHRPSFCRKFELPPNS